MKSYVSTPILLDTKAMEQHRANRHYQTQITEAYSQRFEERLTSDPKSSLLFVTLTFQTSRGQPIRDLHNANGLFTYFHRLYVRLLRRLLKGRFNRPKNFHLQPVALVFLDVDASLKEEQRSIIGPDSPLYPLLLPEMRARSRIASAQVPHLHCLIMVPGEVRTRFNGLMDDPKTFWRSIADQYRGAEDSQVPLRTSDTQRVLRGEVFETLNYASKFLKNAPGRQDTTDLWRIWPTALDERMRKKNGMPYALPEPTIAFPNGVTMRAPTLVTSNTA